MKTINPSCKHIRLFKINIIHILYYFDIIYNLFKLTAALFVHTRVERNG